MSETSNWIWKGLVLFLFDLVITVLFVEESMGVPIALAMGCGKSLNLTVEKKSFCCEQFNLDCPASRKAVGVELPPQNKQEKTQHIIPRRHKVRMLGEDCKEAQVKCATGLQCRRGVCVRRRSQAHLKSLMQRGRLVEQEEREEINPDSDEEREDPLPAQKGLILKGQSVKSSQAIVGPDMAAGDNVTEPRKTPTPRKSTAESGNVNENTALYRKTKVTPLDEKIALNEEEDELAANVADLLSLRLGINLNSAELHNVREIIAGTLDERAEREDEVVQGESQRDEENRITKDQTSGLEQRVEGAEGGGPNQYYHYNHYEPLVQCPSERSSSILTRASESVRTFSMGVGKSLRAEI